METWMQTTFENDGWVIYTQENSSTAIDPTTFDWTQFSAITNTPPTHAELSGLPIASQGWQKIFDQWKANGLIQ